MARTVRFPAIPQRLIFKHTIYARPRARSGARPGLSLLRLPIYSKTDEFSDKTAYLHERPMVAIISMQLWPKPVFRNNPHISMGFLHLSASYTRYFIRKFKKQAK